MIAVLNGRVLETYSDSLVIGVGGIGEGHVRRMAEVVPGGTVVAVSDINTEQGVKVAERYGARCEPDAKALIEATN